MWRSTNQLLVHIYTYCSYDSVGECPHPTPPPPPIPLRLLSKCTGVENYSFGSNISPECYDSFNSVFAQLVHVVYRRLPARRDLFWEDYARSSSRKRVTWIEMIITQKIMAYFWQFSFCIHKNIQVFIWKRLQSQFSLITGEKLRKNL